MDLNTIAEVVIVSDRSALGAWRDGDAYLGGGTALYAEPNPQLRRLIDVTGFDWDAIGLTTAGDIEIAATCTLAQLDAYGQAHQIPLFGRCVHALLGSFKVHNIATVGGNLCSALPAGPMISLAAALDGECLIWAPDGSERRVSALDLVIGPQHSCLTPGELLRSITLPSSALTCLTAFRQYSLSNLGRSAVLVIGRVAGHGVHFTITAATPRPVRLSFASMPSQDELSQVLAASVTDYYDDVHGAPRWRAHLTGRLLEEIRVELSDGPVNS